MPLAYHSAYNAFFINLLLCVPFIFAIVIGVDLAVAHDGFPLQRKSVAILIAEKLSNGTQRLNYVHPFIVDITLLIVLLLFNIMHYSNLFQYFLSMCYGPYSS